MMKWFLLYIVVGLAIDAIIRPRRRPSELAWFWGPTSLKILFVFLRDLIVGLYKKTLAKILPHKNTFIPGEE